MARINGGVVPLKLRRFIISPDNLYYRIWCFILAMLSAYTCSVSLLQWSFITPQAPFFFKFDIIINVLFGVDIFVTFFVAFIDENTWVMVDNRTKIAKRYSKMVVFDLLMCFPFEVVAKRFSTPTLTHTHNILNSLRLLRLFRCYRVASFYLKLEKSDKINFTYMRTAMIITVACFVSHSGACVFYNLATLNSDPKETWIGSQKPTFLQEKWWNTYGISMYWAAVTFSTVGYGDWHAVSSLEMACTVIFLYINLAAVAYITGYITNWMSPAMGKTEEYKERRCLAASFCDRHCIPTPMRDEIFSHLRLEYATDLHGFQYYKDHQLLQSLPRAIKTTILNLLCNKMSHSHLFEEVSTETQFQMVQAMEIVSFSANASVVLQNDMPTCFYFVLTGSVDLIIFENGIEQVAGTIKIGNFVGESCVFTNKPQMFTIKTTQISQLVKIDRGTFLKILEGNPSDGAIMLENHIKLLKLLNDPYLNRVLETLEYQMAIGRMNVPVSVWFAAERDYGQLFYRLLQLNRDPNDADNKGRTPLHIVASRGDLLKVTRLCEYGADPNIKDLDGNTVLHVAVVANKIDIVRCLLEHGANGDIKNTGGSTPIELATLPHQKDIQNLLSTNETTKSSTSV